MSIVLCWPLKVSSRPPVIKLACRRKTGVESKVGSSGLPIIVLRGAMIFSSSMAMGKLSRLRLAMDRTVRLSLWSLTKR